MSEYTTIEEQLSNLKEGESLVALMPSKSKGYFLMIGDNYTDHCWAITQAEVNQLAVLCDKHKTK